MQILIVDSESEASFSRPDLKLHAQWSIVRADSIARLETELKNATSPIDLVILYQDRPKQLSQGAILRCLAATPLTRFVQILGSWCDGDLRTPGRIAGVFPMSFREAEWRLAEIVEQFRLGKGPLVRPLTTPEAMINSDSISQSNGIARQSLRVGV